MIPGTALRRPADALPRHGVIFRAVPDSGRLPVAPDSDGGPKLSVPGHAHLPALQDPVLARAFRDLWFVPGTPLALPPRTDALVNLCADPDLCELGLLALDAALPQGMAVLNHPRAVAMARRDLAASVFGGIEGLQVPAALRLVATSPQAFQMAFVGGGFRYPVDMTPAGATDPRATLRIAGPDGWAALLRGAWGRRVWVMTQAAPALPPWRLALCMAGREGQAEFFTTDPTPPRSAPPALPQDLLAQIARTVCERLPLDIWTLIATPVPGGLVFDRAVPGLALPAVLRAEVAALIAAPDTWRGGGAAALRPVAGYFGGTLT